jgi:hypothetical protein
MNQITEPMVDEQLAINRLSVSVALVRHQIGKDYSHEWLATTLRQYLRGIDVPDDRRLTLAIKAVEAADQGDEIADAALREVGAELIEQRTGRPGDGQIMAYFQRAGLRAPHRRKQGHHWADNWSRDLAICILIQRACLELGVAPTRNRDSRRAGRRPSGVSLATAAFARNGIHLDEGSVQRHIWLGLPGELARQALARHVLELSYDN